MKLTGLQSFAISSLVLATTATAASRPHYGGILHIQIEGAITSLDPAEGSQLDTVAMRNVLGLIFDTLVTLDDRGEPQPALAIQWHAEPDNQRWQFFLRPGITFSDGTPMTPEIVAASLRRANPGWKVLPLETGIVIQLDAASADLPAQLALQRNSIFKVQSGKFLGTGPFVASEWDPGKKLLITARDDYWGGRSFLDSVEIEMGKNFRDEMIAYDLGQSQLIEIPAEQAHHAPETRELRVSQPVELVALLFVREIRSPEEAKQRQALALSIDRTVLNRVVLQGGGEPAGGVLPHWLTGYSFLFPQAADLSRAQQLRAEVPQAPLWTLGFDGNDTLMRLIAERIVLNAGDAGLRLQLSNSNISEVRLVRVPLPSLDPQVALVQIAKSLELPVPRFLGNTVDDLYHAENAMLQSQRLIPLLHLRTAWAVSKTVRNWENTPNGIWRLPDVWLTPDKP
jgi:ABC-type transport system substrate-binding protein